MLTETILERSIFTAIRDISVSMGYTLNISEYDLNNVDDNVVLSEQARYITDSKAIAESKGFYIEVFGFSTSQDKGHKKVPRISVHTRSFIPGQLGGDTTPNYEYNSVSNEYVRTKNPGQSNDYYFSIMITGNSTEQIRLLNSIVLTALPRRGYIKKYFDTTLQRSGNIFVEFTGSDEQDDNSEGVLERALMYSILDVFDMDDIITLDSVPPIIDITTIYLIRD